jgi:hypothetical protein
MNSKLYGEKIELPEEVVVYLGKCFNNVGKNSDESTEGYKRNKELRDSGFITYQQLKRMKNWFDNFQGDKNDTSFILNGGEYLHNWVNQTLENMRNRVNNPQNIRKEYLPKDFIIKSDDLKNLTDLNDSKKSTEEVFGLKIEQTIKRINQLIKTI